MSFNFRSVFCAPCFALVLSGCLAFAGFAEDRAVAAVGPELVQRIEPMDLEGVESRVAYVLRRYYENAFGGAVNWDTIESIRFEGTLRLPQGAVLSFVAFKKKPDYCKIVLFGAGGVRVVMAYDGVDAWQLNTAASAQPVAMPPVEALNFIRDAATGGHLLYPTQPEKRIELLGTRRVGEETCYDLRVTLMNGQQVTYAINMQSYAERQQIVVNAGSGDTEVTTHARTAEVDGLLIPTESTMTVDGEFAHEVRLRSVEVNLGLMPWMFSRPSGAYIPGSMPPPAPELEGEGIWQGLQSDSEALGAEPESFGLEPGPFESPGATRFPGLDAETKESILDDIGKI
jgi:hypothetical protein